MSSLLSDAENMAKQGGGEAGQADQAATQTAGADATGGAAAGGGMDAKVNQEVDSVLTKEGVPAAADGSINKAVDSEISKFT